MEAVITIKGKPIAKHRPKFARRGKFVTTYNDQESEESLVLWEVRQQWKQEPITGPVSMHCYFGMPWPKGTSEKKKSFYRVPHLKKPDCSNLLKFYEDCLNGTVWKDDSQIWKISIEKVYDIEPETILTVIW
jgi:Holliday junction resolvase RusA-like endonuclease